MSGAAGETTATAALDQDDPRVQAYLEAETAAYDHYDLDPTPHVVTIPKLGIDVRVLEVGSGPPLLLIPGGEGSSLPWMPLLQHLDGYTRYVLDRPGAGLSDPIEYSARPFREQAVATIDALFDHFDLDGAPVVGNSMGGLWALRFALAAPDRVGPLALLGCPGLYPGTSAPFPMRLGSVPVLGLLFIDRMIRPADAADEREGLKFQGHPAETRDRLPDPLMEAAYRRGTLPHFGPSWEGLLRQTVRLRGARPQAALTAADLRAVQSPVVLLWGSEDPYGSVATGRAGAEHVPDATFHEVGVGHLPWLDEPARCGELVAGFVERHR